MDRILLVGSEAVENAGATIRSAAQEMQNAAGHIEKSLRLHQRWLDDWISRFEIIVDRILTTKALTMIDKMDDR